jgi:hypothetical protein
MSVNAPKPEAMPHIDYADHTLEIDTRWMLTERPGLKARKTSSDTGANEDPGVGADLTATQVNELLHARK